MKKIAVFCGSSVGFNKVYKEDAIKLASYFAKNEISLVYGGGKIGMMGVLADTMIENGGEVVGVIPEFLRLEEVAHAEISKMVVTKTMSKRKVKISKMVDGYIALPGGFGTLDEIMEALTLGQLGVERKPVGILNTNGFFKPLIQQLEMMVKEGYLKQTNKDMLIVSSSVEDLLLKMYAYQPPHNALIVNKVVQS